MSVRAYRVINIETEENNSFNVWHDQKLMDFLREHGDVNEEGMSESGGIMSVEVKALKAAVKKPAEAFEDYKKGAEDYRVEAIKTVIAFAKDNGNDFVQYYCY